MQGSWRPEFPIGAWVFDMKAMSLKVWSSVVNMITLGLLLAARTLPSAGGARARPKIRFLAATGFPA